MVAYGYDKYCMYFFLLFPSLPLILIFSFMCSQRRPVLKERDFDNVSPTPKRHRPPPPSHLNDQQQQAAAAAEELDVSFRLPTLSAYDRLLSSLQLQQPPHHQQQPSDQSDCASGDDSILDASMEGSLLEGFISDGSDTSAVDVVEEEEEEEETLQEGGPVFEEESDSGEQEDDSKDTQGNPFYFSLTAFFCSTVGL